MNDINKNKIKCAVIGVGYLGKFHAEKYYLLPNAKLAAVCDVDAAQCQKLADLYHVPAYTDYVKLIQEIKPQAVSIVVPTSLHHQVTKTFLEHGIHVLLEKPITRTITEADELIALSQEKKLVLQIGHLERFNPAILALTDLLDISLSNTADKSPLFLEATRLAPFKPRGTDVSVILDLMIHDIDLVQHLTSSPLKNISAYGAAILSKHIDFANARIEFANGSVASLTASRVSVTPQRQLNIFQPKTSTFINADLNEKSLIVSHKNCTATDSEMIKEIITLDKGDAIMDEIKAFINTIDNATPSLVSGEDGKKALATALQIEREIIRSL